MRDKLQALVEQMKSEHAEMLSVGGATALVCAVFHNTVIHKLESILATEPPAVKVRAGWYAKDFGGFWYFAEKPVFMNGWWVVNYSVAYDRVNRIVNDPWSQSHPNGGPECLLEVK